MDDKDFIAGLIADRLESLSKRGLGPARTNAYVSIEMKKLRYANGKG